MRAEGAELRRRPSSSEGGAGRARRGGGGPVVAELEQRKGSESSCSR